MTSPAASSSAALRRMQRQRRRDTRPEVNLRRYLHRAGLRFRVDVAPLEGMRRRADVAFRPARVAVFVDGCFWHGCPDHGTVPKANADWWINKLAVNKRRDEDTDRRLELAGWAVVRVWEHEDSQVAATQIIGLVEARRGRSANLGRGCPVFEEISG